MQIFPSKEVIFLMNENYNNLNLNILGLMDLKISNLNKKNSFINKFFIILALANNREILNSNFQTKKIRDWNVDDVIAWLGSLQLAEHKERFLSARITGKDLLLCNRTFFTRLGVTRIAHRQIIEQSIKNLISSSS